VGHDTYHHTLFEMLGNWSFGDYYKKEAIAWAWELLTGPKAKGNWEIDKSRLYATVFETDDEAFALWQSETDIDPTHIIRCGAKDNFWEMGDTGPCGPCSEIHYDSTTDKSGGPLVNTGSPEVIEIWNLVFIQYNRGADGTLTELPMKHVDTGMGFERICAVLQNKKSNYDTDVFQPYIKWFNDNTVLAYRQRDDTDIAMRVIADHIRTLTSAIADGALPGNEGRGYVLRRILRRAARYGRELHLNDPFLYKLAEIVANEMGSVFPEMRDRLDLVQKVIRAEEENFNLALSRGLDLFIEMSRVVEDSESPSISGEEAFKLYDTFGFPIDLTQVLARERGISVDMEGFEELLQEQKRRSRADRAIKSTRFVRARVFGEEEAVEMPEFRTEFTGYDELETRTKIEEDNDDNIILKQTPFYAESGGQIADTGVLSLDDGSGLTVRVSDVRKYGNAYLHALASESPFLEGQTIIATVDRLRRIDIMRNHSATHLMHSALRKVLGEHVHQAGSLVTENHLRFDFSHFQKVTNEELREIEAIVNEKIRESIRLIHHRNIPFEEAKKMGALMFFGDKYGAKVNVVDFGPFSREFCGGTHIGNTAEIGLFKFVSEGSIASGVRRIEAVTGRGVESWLIAQEKKHDELSREFENVQAEKQKLEKELTKLRLEARRAEMRQLAASAKPIEGSSVRLISSEISVRDSEELKSLGEMLLEDLKHSAVGVLGAKLAEEKVSLVAVVTDDLIKEKKLQAGKLVGQVAEIVGGKGGGRPQLAQAGGRFPEKLAEALAQVESMIREKIS
jgi:alanyl-tRNA synthetase